MRLRMAIIGTKRQIRRIWCCRSTYLTICNVFYVLILKKHVLTVSHLTVTLRMMSNSRRSSPVINAHLPIDQADGSYCSDLKNGSNHPVSNCLAHCCDCLYGELFRTMWSRDRDVVLVGCAVDLGKPGGAGKLEWGGNGERMGRGRSVYEQPGTRVDGIAPHKRRDSK